MPRTLARTWSGETRFTFPRACQTPPVPPHQGLACTRATRPTARGARPQDPDRGLLHLPQDAARGMRRASRHPIAEGKVVCSDCHNPHGTYHLPGANVRHLLHLPHGEARAVPLHSHEPVQEDCTICHNPHGSSNPTLLKVRLPFLCQTCHEPNRHPGTMPDPTAKKTGLSNFNTKKAVIMGRGPGPVPRRRPRQQHAEQRRCAFRCLLGRGGTDKKSIQKRPFYLHGGSGPAAARVWSRAGAGQHPRQLTKPQSSINVGVGYVRKDNQRFGQYNGLTHKEPTASSTSAKNSADASATCTGSDGTTRP